jgi:hypothetical protein
MSELMASKSFNLRKILTLIALAAAATTAYGAVNYIAYGGITYYTICAIAILFNYRRASLMLWAAVGVHAVLVSYALWSWQTAGAHPCPYCFGAAGFALLAATIFTRLPAAILPVILITGVWFAWPHVFVKSHAGASQQPVSETQSQTPGTQPASQPVVVVNTGSGENNTGNNTTKDNATQPENTQLGASTDKASPVNQQPVGSDSAQPVEQTSAAEDPAQPTSQQGQTVSTPVTGVQPDIKKGNTSTPGTPPANNNPAVKTDNDTTNNTAEPEPEPDCGCKKK